MTRTPHDDIRAGLLLVRHGLSDLREDYERTAAEQDLRRAQAVDAEAQLRALSGEAYRAKRYRHLQPGELCGPRRQPSDLRSATPPPRQKDEGPGVSPSPSHRKSRSELVTEGPASAPSSVQHGSPDVEGPRPGEASSGQEVGDFDPRGTVTEAPALDAVTARSLRDMGLVPGARWASTPPTARTWRNLWGLVQG